MANLINIKKGLQIPLQGASEEILRGSVTSEFVRICPKDFHGITPKLTVKVDDRVKAGNALFYAKDHPEILFASPVSGVVTNIERGEKRRILNIVIKADSKIEYEDFGVKNVSTLSSEEVKQSILDTGLWFLIKQRPYDVVAVPGKQPRDIFVTGFDSAPLAPSYDFMLEGQEADLQTGLDVLAKLTSGRVYLSVSTKTKSKALLEAKNVVITKFNGPHPAGNVGVQINHIKPINRGEVVWTLNAMDVALLGRFFQSGHVDLTRTVELCGSEVKQTGYYKMLIGTELKSIFKDNVTEGISLRYISGNPLTGCKIDENGVLHAYDSQVTVIPEGDDIHEAFGWASFSPKRYSAGCTYPTHNKKYRLDARLMGGPRAIIVSNEYDKEIGRASCRERV